MPMIVFTRPHRPLPLYSLLRLVVPLAGLAWLLLVTASLAQPKDKVADSLQTLLANRPQADTTRVKLLLELATHCSNDAQCLRQLAQEAWRLSGQLGYEAGQARALVQIGIAYEKIGNISQALACGQRVLRLPVTGHNPRLQAEALNLIGMVYKNQGQYAQALAYQLQSLKAAEQADAKRLVANAVGNIGLIYADLGDWPQAMAYDLRALKLLEQLDRKTHILLVRANIGDLYRRMGNYPKALAFDQQALTMALAQNNRLVEGIASSNLADVYELQGQYGPALTRAHQALTLAKAIDKPGLIAWCWQVLARVHLHTNRPDSARFYGLRSLQLARQSGLRASIRDVGLVLAQTYTRQQDYAKAYRYQRLFTTYQDSLASEDTRNQVGKLQFQYELDKKEAAIALLTKDKTIRAETARRQRQLLIAFVVGLGLVVVLALVLWRNNRTQQRANTQIEQDKKIIEEQAQALQRLNEIKSRFFANISHEFRTPLTLILGPIEQAVQEYAHDTRFSLIQRNANRLLSLINQLLDLSKLEAGQLRTEPEPGDIATFFRILASSFHSLAESRTIRFTFTQNEEERQALFDRDKLEKIVTNLLANAIKFTPAGKEVRMSVQYARTGMGRVQFTVEDTGIGMAPQQLPHIFDRFYQGSVLTADGRTTPPYEGTGIGLALVSELVKVLKGTIDVVSTEGLGTTFTVTLPLADVLSDSRTDTTFDNGKEFVRLYSANAGAVATQTTAIGSGTPVLSVRGTDNTASVELSPTSENVLLIIDDNVDIRAYVRSIFENNYHIIEAVDGQDGLEKATASLPNVVICDLMMPRLDGFGFCKALKSGEATSHIPVVMLTARATVEDRIEGFELGADDYLTKPFNRAEIQARVRNLVEQRQRLYRRFALVTPEGPAILEGTEPTPVRLAAEQQFLDRLTAVVMGQLDNTTLSVETLAEAVHMSRVQLHRKLRALANTTPSDFIRYIRLTQATQLLQAGDQSVTQVAYAVGFDNLSYFAKVFQERYGVLPSRWGKASSSAT
jgi:signal transduction histidine kinase/DNA-binding response OmpR family regulator